MSCPDAAVTRCEGWASAGWSTSRHHEIAGGTPPSKPKTGLIVAIVAGVLIVVLALCGLGYFLVSGDDDDKETTSSSSTESSSDSSSDSSSSSESSDESSSSSSSSSTDESSSSSTSDDTKEDEEPGTAKFGKKYTGDGNSELPAPEVDGPALMKVHYAGGSNFIIWGTDADGKDSELVLNTIGATDGTIAYNVSTYGEPTAGLRVETDAPWSVTFEKLDSAPKFGDSQTGQGPKVFAWDGSKSDLSVNYKGSDDAAAVTFEVVGFDTSGNAPDRILSEPSDYDGTVTVQEGTEYIAVQGSGKWELSKK